MDPFLAYRQAHDELDADPNVTTLSLELERARLAWEDARKPYLDRMREAEEVIRGAVLEQGKSVTLHNVEARYSKGRASTSWKSVADEVGAPPEIVAKHTKEGEPSVSVRLL